MKYHEFNHESGLTIIDARLLTKTRNAMQEVKFKIHHNCATDLRNKILNRLAKDGWSNEIRISKIRKLTLTSMHGHVGLCLQTGNMARFYADMLKLQTQYLNKNIVFIRCYEIRKIHKAVGWL